MRGQIVLSTLTGDRQGIVGALTSLLAGFDLNIEKSRMAVMGKEFSTVLLVSGDKPDLERFLTEADDRFVELNMDWVVRPTGLASERDMEASLPYHLSVAAIDHIGLVAQVTHLLAQHGANVEDLDTASHPAPESGTPVFYLSATVLIPESVRIDAVRTALYDLADRMNIDLSLEST